MGVETVTTCDQCGERIAFSASFHGCVRLTDYSPDSLCKPRMGSFLDGGDFAQPKDFFFCKVACLSEFLQSKFTKSGQGKAP